MNRVKNISLIEFFEIIFSLCLILSPFLSQYASLVGFLSAGDFLLVLTSFLLIIVDICSGKKIRVFYPTILLGIVFFVLTLVIIPFGREYYAYYDSLTFFLKIIMYCIVINLALTHFKFKKVKSIYVVFCAILCLYLFLQFIYHKATGKYLPIYFNYNWLCAWEKRAQSLYEYYTVTYNGFRPSSLFLEPGYYAFYIIPCLYILLIKDHKIILPLVLTVSLVLSTSNAGIGLGFIGWLLFILNKFFVKQDGKILFKKKYVPLCVVAVILVILYLIYDNSLLMRFLGGSFGSRVTRGFIIFKEVDGFHKIFGVGMNNIANYVTQYRIFTVYDEPNLNTACSVTAILLQYGIFGLAAFCVFVLAILKKASSNYMAFALVLAFVIYAVFEDVMFNFRMGYFMSFILTYMNYAHSKAEIKKFSPLNIEVKTVEEDFK